MDGSCPEGLEVSPWYNFYSTGEGSGVVPAEPTGPYEINLIQEWVYCESESTPLGYYETLEMCGESCYQTDGC